MTPEKNEQSIHPLVKVFSGFDASTSDEVVRRYFQEEFPALLEKPCGVLMWCPYGPLVEDFPLANRKSRRSNRRTPMAKPEPCAVFGHDCPVFYVAEPMLDPDAVAGDCICDDCRRKMEEQDLESVENDRPDSESGVSTR